MDLSPSWHPWPSWPPWPDHHYCRVFKLKKSKKRKIRIFEKPDFPVRIRIRWYGNIQEVTLRSQRSVEAKKSEKKIPENFFSLFLLLWTSWDLRDTPQMFRYHLIRFRTVKSGISKIRIFRFFWLFKLKDPTIWVSNDSPWLPDGPLMVWLIVDAWYLK